MATIRRIRVGRKTDGKPGHPMGQGFLIPPGISAYKSFTSLYWKIAVPDFYMDHKTLFFIRLKSHTRSGDRK
jgi:hypothetical protein